MGPMTTENYGENTTMATENNSGRCGFEPLLDSQEVGKLMGVHPETVKRRARNGEIPGVKFGKLWRFRASALDSYIQRMMLQKPTSVAGLGLRRTSENL
jgi:excisionase family DNA binding protein